MANTTKECPQCGNTQLALISTENLKYCPDCNVWIPWELAEGQQPLITNNRIKAGQRRVPE